MPALPGANALDDEEPLAWLHEANPPCLTSECCITRCPRESSFEAYLLGSQYDHLSAAVAEFVARLDIAREGPVVEERHHSQDRDGEQEAEPTSFPPKSPCGSLCHGSSFALSRVISSVGQAR